MVNNFGPSATFIIFASASSLACLYLLFVVKDTTSAENKDGTKYTLNEKQKKQLYWPVEFK